MSDITTLTDFKNFHSFTPGEYRGGLSILNSGKSSVKKLDTEEEQLYAYNNCPPLKSIIGRRGKYFSVGKVDVYDKKQQQVATGAEAGKLRALLATPNPLQTGKQFFVQQNAYIDLFGWCAVLIVKPYGMVKVTGMWNIPPWLLTPKYETERFWSIADRDSLYSTFTFAWKNEDIPFNKEDVKIIFDDGFGTQNNMDLTIPDSRLKGNEYSVSNIMSALKAQNLGITEAGPTGILSNNAKDASGFVPMKPGESERVQNEFKSKYGITGQPYRVIISEASLSWQQMGSNLKDMDLPETIAGSIRNLCDAYGWPPELMAGTNADINYENKEHAKKDAYTGTIIPESESRWQQRSDQLIDPALNLEIKADFSMLSLLQEDKKLSAEVDDLKVKTIEKSFKNNFITFNQCLVALGYEEVEDSIGKQRYSDLLNAGWSFGNTTLGGGDVAPVAGK